jgi:hypothetical protein
MAGSPFDGRDKRGHLRSFRHSAMSPRTVPVLVPATPVARIDVPSAEDKASVYLECLVHPHVLKSLASVKTPFRRPSQPTHQPWRMNRWFSRAIVECSSNGGRMYIAHRKAVTMCIVSRWDRNLMIVMNFHMAS